MKVWWCGDSRVEKYMVKVSAALNRCKLNNEQHVDIYNRCYEAVYQAIIDRDILKTEEV